MNRVQGEVFRRVRDEVGKAFGELQSFSMHPQRFSADAAERIAAQLARASADAAWLAYHTKLEED